MTIEATIGHRRISVLRDVSFQLRPGRVLGVVGESGAGKSMIGRAIAQNLPAGFSVAGGSLRLGQDDLVSLSAARRRALLGRDLAFIPQEPMTALNPLMTVGAQMMEHLRRLGVGSKAAQITRAIALLEAVHLPGAPGLLQRYPHQLSGGMCQRVLIAMAFAARPQIIVADEPTTALDVTIQARIVQLIVEMQRQAATSVLFITHDLRLASRICDDIIVLYAGRMVESGAVTSLLSNPAHPYTKCLQLAAPTMQGTEHPLFELPDRMPGLMEQAALTGCRFAPRCPIARDDCVVQEPAQLTIGPAHLVACPHSGHTNGIERPAATPAQSRTKMADALLRLTDVGRDFVIKQRLFSASQKYPAVRNATLSIGAGEFVGLVGESGSGKSTLARLVMGLDRCSSGRILLGDRDVTRASAADRQHRLAWAQMVFQDPQSALNPRRRVGDIVTQVLQGQGHRQHRAERMQRARDVLHEVGLGADMLDRYPGQLSGGQRQRVNIARAICAAPRLLVADEIVSGLDVSIQAQLLRLLQRLRQELGIALLFISHDLSVVRYLCDRVLVMHGGEIVEQGETERVFSAPVHPYTKRLLAAVPPDDPSLAWSPFPDAIEASVTPDAGPPRTTAATPSR